MGTNKMLKLHFLILSLWGHMAMPHPCCWVSLKRQAVHLWHFCIRTFCGFPEVL